jgi:hypothetical protein
VFSAAQYEEVLSEHLHTPAAQISPELQAFPHAPQFCVSLLTSRHLFCAAQYS